MNDIFVPGQYSQISSNILGSGYKGNTQFDFSKLEDQVRQTMIKHGLKPPAQIVFDGTIHRFATNRKLNDTAGWYVLFGDGIPAGVLGDWREGTSYIWNADVERKLSKEELHQIQERQREARRLREETFAEEYRKASDTAQRIWNACEYLDGKASHPYLTNKQVASHGLKVNHKGNLVLPLYNKHGVIASLQYIYSDGRKMFLPGGQKKGSFWWLGNLENAQKAFMAEGYSSGSSIYESTGFPVIIAYDAGNLTPAAQAVKEKYPKMELVIAADNDASGAGERAARAAGKETGARVILIPELGMDANDYAQTGKDLKGLLLAEEDHIDPVDPFGTIQAPPFDLGLLPDVLRRYVKDQSELMGVDPGVMAMFSIAATATALDHRLQIQPKRHDPTWTEAPRLWIAVVGDPSTMKTPALTKAFSPIRKLEAEASRQYQIEKGSWKTTVSSLKKGDEKPPEPVQERITITDATIEKIADILGKLEPRGITAIHDELSGWLSGMDAYKGNGVHKDRAAWLTAYNGGPLQVDRVNRGSTFVENWSIAVTGGIQPSVLHSYMNAADHDGLLPRFLVYNARPKVKDVDRYPDMDAKKAYHELICHLRGLKPGSEIMLSEDAHQVREYFNQEIDQAIRCSDNQLTKASFSKWTGTWARLTLVIHCIEAASKREHPSSFHVSWESAESAADIMRLLMRHALKFYAGADTVGDKSQELAALILAHQWERFTVRRNLAKDWKASRRMKPWEIEATLDRLEGYGWIMPELGRVNERGRPVAYKVNTKVHKIYAENAEQERIRRKEIQEFMKGLQNVDFVVRGHV